MNGSRAAVRYGRALAFVLMSALAAPAAAQERPSNVLPPGTGSISGRVIAADTHKPIRNALVEIVIYRNLSGRFGQTTTDAQGKFTLPNLPAGQFQIAAQATRYLRMNFGQLEPGPGGQGNQPRVIELTNGQAFVNADFTLQHFSAIEGTVIDEFGDPAPNVMLQASQVLFAGGRPRLVPVGPGLEAGPLRSTDDTGHFRIAGLSPGDYYVEALSGAFADPSAVGGFAVTYFPGTADSSAARMVTLAPGHDAMDVSFALVPAVTAPVAGMLVDGEGQPLPGGNLMLLSAESAGPPLFMMIRGVAGEGGRFAFRNVPAGKYTIQAFGVPIGNAGNLGAFAFGYLTFSVGDNRDTAHLTVRVPAPRTLRGHITFDDDPATPRPKPADVFVSPRPVEFESAPIGGGPAPVTVHDDWTFEVRAMSGLRVVVAGAPGWLLKSVRLDGDDVIDSALDLREHDVNNVELVFTTRATMMTATVAVPKDRALSDYNVLVFAADDTKWTLWSRYVAIIRPNQKGTFTIRGLPPGSYYALPVGALSSGEWQDPDYLLTLRSSGEAVLFSLSEGESTTVSLTTGR